MNDSEFFTIQNSIESLLVIKKSKFIANARPVENQEEAEKYLDLVRKKYWDAAHNVYAYVIGLKDEVQKFSDDGEPAGTAGRPVLEVIKSKGLKNVLVVVTRYFGGILLGAGGLARAYSDSAGTALEKAGIIKKIKCDEYEVSIEYNMLGKVQWEIKQKNLIPGGINYTEKVSLRIYVPFSSNLNFTDYILNITSGNAAVKWMGECYVDEAIRGG
jgi:uncharacterized YigZ family protein